MTWESSRRPAQKAAKGKYRGSFACVARGKIVVASAVAASHPDAVAMRGNDALLSSFEGGQRIALPKGQHSFNRLLAGLCQWQIFLCYCSIAWVFPRISGIIFALLQSCMRQAGHVWHKLEVQ